jgi:hypothetical protein
MALSIASKLSSKKVPRNCARSVVMSQRVLRARLLDIIDAPVESWSRYIRKRDLHTLVFTADQASDGGSGLYE